MGDLPTGTVTLLFTDIEGSTRLVRELGDRYADALGEYRRVLRDVLGRHGGVEVDTEGDAFFVAFSRAKDALAAAEDAQNAFAGGVVRVRMGIHTGEPFATDAGYVGIDVHRAARIAAAAHGGQIIVSQSTRDLVGPEHLRDLGEHRLKDLPTLEWLYQVGEGEYPPLRTMNRTTLPVVATPFVGRRREVEELSALLRGDARLVTVVGTGGCGKTRLAIQAASELRDEFPGGVFFVPLAPLTSAELVEPAISEALGAEGDTGAFLRGRTALLLLDNFEHVVAAAAGVVDLLGRAPRVKVLATSRTPLRLAGEIEYVLEPLDQEEAVALFLARARYIGKPLRTDDVDVAAICRRLDRLPLALELAAARLNVLDPQALLDRLDRRLSLLTGGPLDAPERQQTLHATIEWSFELLDERAKSVFLALGVFPGTFTVEAAEEVADADLETLTALAELSLLKRDGARLLMLETLREFAREGLGLELGERRARLARLTAPLLESAARQPLDGADREAVETFYAEFDNVRETIAWAVENDRVLALRLLTSAHELLRDAGLRVVVLQWLQSVYRRDDPPDVRREALRALLLEARHDDLVAAQAYGEELLELARRQDDPGVIASALTGLGIVALRKHDSEAARDLFSDAIHLAQGAGDERREAYARLNLGAIELESGDYDSAVGCLEEAGRMLRRVGGTLTSRAACARSLAEAEAFRGGRSRAAAVLREALLLDERAHSRGGLTLSMDIAAFLAAEDDPALTARLLGAGDAVFDELGFLRARAGLAERAATTAENALGATFGGFRDEGRQLGQDSTLRLALSYLESL